MRFRIIIGIISCLLIFSSAVSAASKVKMSGRELLADFDKNGEYTRFTVKGVGYVPSPIGSFPDGVRTCFYTGEVNETSQFNCDYNVYNDPAVLDRDLPLIAAMHANTIRTWSEVTPLLLDKAQENHLKVIAGFWIPYDWDFTKEEVRQTLLETFRKYVEQYKDHSALLLWGLSNENNLYFCDCCSPDCNQPEQAKAFYSLVNQMAEEAKRIEGENSHPVMIVSADIGDIGKEERGADDASIPFIDLHGINAYRGQSFEFEDTNLFAVYKKLSKKGMLITEFGTDAWHTMDIVKPERGLERQDLQALYLGLSWDAIIKNGVRTYGPANGGVVFIYSDPWWAHAGSWSKTAATHDYGFSHNWSGGQPDGFVNEEWWGIMALEMDPQNPKGPNLVKPREAYYELQKRFGKVK
jgi:hypothetical protein